ncbi:MAG: aspartate/glutamate racemase family protein [Ruminiclostridium sp.]
MKKIGLMGGLGPASTVEYYTGLVDLALSEHNNAYPKIIIDSVDMAEHTKYFDERNYDKIAELIIDSLNVLKGGGAQIAAITANTEHIVWDRIKDRLPLETISIVDAVIDECIAKGYKRIVVFATEWTLRSGLYSDKLSKAGIIPTVPCDEDITILGKLIYPNLENGIVIPEDKVKMTALAEKYIDCANADALLLGCTEIPLMIKGGDVSVPIIDSTKIHIKAIYDRASR